MMSSTDRYFPRPDSIYYFWKGRVALYTILQAFGIGPGDEVILPGFTCVVVANAVLYRGAKPVYADIDPRTYNVSADTIESLITDRTKIILAQNTFGLSPDLDPIMELAEEHDIRVIEDCAQGLGGRYRGKPSGTVAPASFFSTQWSKPVSTGLGGFAYIADREIARKMEKIQRDLQRPSLMEEGILAAQLLMRPLLRVPFLYYRLIKLYRYLTRTLGFSVGSSTGQELKTIEMPEGYLKKMGMLQKWVWRKRFSQLDEMVNKRQVVAKRYDTFFQSIGFDPPYKPEYADHSMLRYTIRVDHKDEILEKAKRLNVPLGDWFVSPLDPVEGDLSPWGYHEGQCPNAEKAASETVNLIPDQPVTDDQLKALFT